MITLQRVLLSAVFATAFCGIGCEDGVCSDYDLELCEEEYNDCLEDPSITEISGISANVNYGVDVDFEPVADAGTDAGMDPEDSCAVEYCQCLDDVGCDRDAIPVCEE